MENVNYLAILVAALISMPLGAIWFGPLFGKKWMEIIGASALDTDARKKMRKASGKLYLIQILITLFQVWVLAHFMSGWDEFSTPMNILWIWAGFVLPTVAGAAMWNMNSGKIKWAQFLIQGGYQLILFIIFGFILSLWK